MLSLLTKPIADSYWVIPGRLLAGEYPRNIDLVSSSYKLGNLLDAGVTYFLDLTAPWEGGHQPYLSMLHQEAAKRQVAFGYRRMPIMDYNIPSGEQMIDILNTIEAALKAYHIVYVHCFGGMGRTGTVIGCYLVRQGMPGDEAIRQIALWRHDTPDGHRPSPTTEQQRRMVLNWPPGR